MAQLKKKKKKKKIETLEIQKSIENWYYILLLPCNFCIKQFFHQTHNQKIISSVLGKLGESLCIILSSNAQKILKRQTWSSKYSRRYHRFFS